MISTGCRLPDRSRPAAKACVVTTAKNMTKKAYKRPPKHLAERGRTFWAHVASAFALEDSDLPLLTAAAEMLDRAEQAKHKLAAEGMTAVDRFGQTKPHPAVEIERASLLAFVRIRRELGLDAGPADSRPPLPKGYR